MRRHLFSATSVIFVFGMFASLGRAVGSPEEDAHIGESKDLPVVECPVTGEPANLALSVPTDDGPVFICCKGCARKLQAEPEKYAAAVAEQREALAARPKVQVTCPVSGEPADPKVGIDHEGTEVHFCCAGCVDKYKADPGKYKSALANSYTYQTRCPVTEEPIDPSAFTTLANGAKVYFCCKGCEKKLFANPAEYAPKLAAQGVTFNAKTLVAPSAEPPALDHEGHQHDHGD